MRSKNRREREAVTAKKIAIKNGQLRERERVKKDGRKIDLEKENKIPKCPNCYYRKREEGLRLTRG